MFIPLHMITSASAPSKLTSSSHHENNDVSRANQPHRPPAAAITTQVFQLTKNIDKNGGATVYSLGAISNLFSTRKKIHHVCFFSNGQHKQKYHINKLAVIWRFNFCKSWDLGRAVPLALTKSSVELFDLEGESPAAERRRQSSTTKDYMHNVVRYN